MGDNNINFITDKKNLTAVEWLYKNIKHIIPNDFLEVFEQAKQMEKDQMHKCASYWRGKENEIEKPIFNEYYNETYKNK